jgi:hypothetical protein
MPGKNPIPGKYPAMTKNKIAPEAAQNRPWSSGFRSWRTILSNLNVSLLGFF